LHRHSGEKQSKDAHRNVKDCLTQFSEIACSFDHNEPRPGAYEGDASDNRDLMDKRAAAGCEYRGADRAGPVSAVR